MTNYFFTGGDGKKRGPYNAQHVHELVTRGLIGANTPLETDTGVTIVTRQVPGLNFDAASTSGIPNIGFFDFGFTRFITNTWISIIWRIAVALVFVAWGLWVIGGLFAMTQNADGILMGIGMILLVTIIAPIELLIIRIVLEFVIVVFRIETHQRTIKEILERNEKASKP
jgi:hypothetical protein